MIERLERLPVWARVVSAALAMAAATFAELTLVAKSSPLRVDVAIAAALGALAAWPFAWRARSRIARAALVGGILLFAGLMVWARMNGRLHSSFAFIFSVILLSIPVQRARGA